MQSEHFEHGMRALCAAWPEREASKELLAAYWIALSHLDDVSFQRAVKRALQGCVFFPKPAEILSRTGVRDLRDLPPLTWDEMTPRERALYGQSEVYAELAEGDVAAGGPNLRGER